ncbi:MAG: class I SAM-dependent methyltransferase [Clostridia bacterium]|nr:class I SAM-dependent methyltransferase [Clostridia bacterium]
MPTLLLDLCCGTGGFSNCFAEKRVSVIGTDLSPEMLAVARENSLSAGQDVLYLCQNATELDLYGTVDGAVCCMDSLNHITDYEDLCTAIEKVSLFLEKDRLFIFDVNTLYKHEEVLGDNIFVRDGEHVYCVWSNFYDPETHITEMELDFFTPQEDGRYTRTEETITERAYTAEELQDALKHAGLETVAIYDDMTLDDLKVDSQRAIYVTRKV